MVKEKEFISALNMVLDKPGMYRIQRVEDIWIFISAEIIINKNEEIAEWSGRFSEFVRKEVNISLVDFDWCSIVRLYSGGDIGSIELFKRLYFEFTSQ